jgi:hypothetical protein
VARVAVRRARIDFPLTIQAIEEMKHVAKRDRILFHVRRLNWRHCRGSDLPQRYPAAVGAEMLGLPCGRYQYLGATEEERQKNLNVFKQWVGKNAWKLNRWEARGEVPAITKQDMDKIKVRY